MDHLSTVSKNTGIKGRAKFISEMSSIPLAAFCHFLADMFGIISKLSLKMQRNDLILKVAVSLLHETVANLQALKSRPVPYGHLKPLGISLKILMLTVSRHYFERLP